MKDEITPDEVIIRRISYLETFCENIIRAELEKYTKQLINCQIVAEG